MSLAEPGGVGKDTRRMLSQTPKGEQREQIASNNIKINYVGLMQYPHDIFLIMKQPCLEHIGHRMRCMTW